MIIIILVIDIIFRFFVPFSQNIIFLIFCLVFIYGSSAVVNVAVITYRQSVVEDELQGRVNAAFRTTVFSAQPIGQLLGGCLIDSFGARFSLLVSAFFYSTILLLALLAGLYCITEGEEHNETNVKNFTK